MLIKSVTIYVKPNYIQEFITATLENQSYSLKEDGILEFQLLQCNDNPGKFMLYEVYITEEAINAHLQTPHFKKWIDTVTSWFVGPRERDLYTPVTQEM